MSVYNYVHVCVSAIMYVLCMREGKNGKKRKKEREVAKMKTGLLFWGSCKVGGRRKRWDWNIVLFYTFFFLFSHNNIKSSTKEVRNQSIKETNERKNDVANEMNDIPFSLARTVH